MQEKNVKISPRIYSNQITDQAHEAKIQYFLDQFIFSIRILELNDYEDDLNKSRLKNKWNEWDSRDI